MPLNANHHPADWLIAFLFGSFLTASLFLGLTRLQEFQLHPMPDAIEIDLMPWQPPAEQPQPPAPEPPKPKKPKPKPKPKPPLIPEPKPVPKPEATPEPAPEPVTELPPEPPPPEPEEPLAETTDQPAPPKAESEPPLPPPASLAKLTALPRFVHKAAPKYPPQMKAVGKEATVKLEVYIDANGQVREINILQSAGDAFDQAAIEAVRASSFEPGRVESKPVPVLLRFPVQFKLR